MPNNNIGNMIRVKAQKHLMYFNQQSTYYTSYQFNLQKTNEREDKDKNNDETNKQLSIKIINFDKFQIQIQIQNKFTYQWKSDNYIIDHHKINARYGKCPFSLENYLELYQDPKLHTFHLVLKPQLTKEAQLDLIGQNIGKLIIKTTFKSNPFKLPVNILSSTNLNIQCIKKLSIFSPNVKQETIFCSGQLISTEFYDQVAQFDNDSISNFSQLDTNQPIINSNGYKLYKYEVEERVEAKNIIIFKGIFQILQFSMDNAIIKIYSFGQVSFLPTLNQILMQIKVNMIQIQSLHIFQNVNTDIEDGYRTVFYTNLNTLYKRIYRSYLYNKIKDQWIIEGMINYNRSTKHFQTITKKLIDLLLDGEQLVSLQQEIFHFDPVWKTKATFLYHILSNFKLIRDFGSSSLANLIIQQSRKAKVTSQQLFKKLKNKYGLKNFRTIYEQQFVKSTGINRIYYEIMDVKKQNKVKIIVRQRSLANKFFSLYNKFRIKLQIQYKHLSPLTSRIINKNGFQNTNQGKIKKQLVGPLAVPKILKCLPYFRGNVTVQTDASEIAFELELKQENIIQEKQNVTSKIRAPIRKIGDNQKAYDGYEWMMIDTAHIFPAVYKNDNVIEAIILQKIKKKYESQHEELKVLNCISSRDHSKNEKICRALIQKAKIHTNYKDNSSINIKLKILQILPVFLSNAHDFTLWEQFLCFLKLYQPVCQDYSDEGYYFLLSLIQSTGEIQYKKQFSYYFQHFHRIMLRILRQHNALGEQRQQKLKICLFNSMMKWKSRYSLQIIQQVLIELKLSRKTIRQNIQLLKTIFQNIYPYLKMLKLDHNNYTVKQLYELMAELISKDKSFSLFIIKFTFDIKQSEKSFAKPFQYLKSIFTKLQDLQSQSIRKYSRALESVKNIFNKSKKLCGLQIQLISSQNQNYFLAEYLWEQLTCQLSSNNQFIRLQWIKIYRIFYFYYIPIITIHKLNKSLETREFRHISPQAHKEILENIKDFTPDIKWLSGYDSRSAKELKAKYQQMNQSKRKKKIEEYHFSQNNAITQFIKSHPGRETWDQLGREAIRIFISIYEDKQQKTDGKQAEIYKKVQQGFKGVQQKLKRGRMPDFYNYNQLKQQIVGVLELYNQQQIKVFDILKMVDKSLEQIQKQKMKQQAQFQQDDMHIIIGLNSILEQEQQEEARNENGQVNNEQNNGNEDEMLFNDDYEQQKWNEQQADGQEYAKQQAKDDDQLMFQND